MRHVVFNLMALCSGFVKYVMDHELGSTFKVRGMQILVARRLAADFIEHFCNPGVSPLRIYKPEAWFGQQIAVRLAGLC